MRTKDDVLGIWHDYIDTYKHIKDNIGKWLDEKHLLPFNELWDVLEIQLAMKYVDTIFYGCDTNETVYSTSLTKTDCG